jgi:hypothetical protein
VRAVKRLVLGAVVACMLLAPTVVYASWSVPVQVVSSQTWRFGPAPPVLVTDAQDDGVLVWHRQEILSETSGGVEVATQHVGGAWSAPVVLSSPHHGYATSPDVVTGSEDEGVATWEQFAAGVQVVEVTQESQGGSWERPVRVSRPAEDGGEPNVAVDKQGDASVVFVSNVGKTETVKLSVERNGRGWGHPRTVGGGSVNIREPRVAVDSRGETIVAWISGSNEDKTDWVQAAIFDSKGQREGAVQKLSSRRGHSTELRLAANEQGDSVLAWRQAGVKRRPIEVATRTSGARFTGAATVSTGDDVEPTAAIQHDGDAAVLFTRILTTQPQKTQTSAVEVVSHQGHGHWTHPAQVAPAAEGSTLAPQIASAPAGNQMMAVWTDARFRGNALVTEPGKVEATTINPGESLQPPTTISAGESYEPLIAVSSNGDATAAWVTRSEPEKSISPELDSRTESLQVADYAPTP